jgi:ATP-dependent helicase/nuclease subunit B
VDFFAIDGNLSFGCIGCDHDSLQLVGRSLAGRRGGGALTSGKEGKTKKEGRENSLSHGSFILAGAVPITGVGLRYKRGMELPRGIAAAIEAGDTVIASSARAARALRRLHGEAQRKLGLQAWQSPDILDWDSWLHRLWQKQLRSGNESRLLLTSLQEQQVWARLVRPSIEGKRLISVLGVSELAQQAYGLLCAYGALDFLNGEGLGGSDVEAFRGWGRGFSRLCEKEGWLSRSMLPVALRDGVAPAQVEATAHLMLIGFDRITPAQQGLIESFRNHGHYVQLAEAEDASATTPILLVDAIDKKDEIATCALWVRHALAAEGRPRIGVVVPSVATMRPDIERVFRQILAPQAVAIGAHDGPLPFEFSLGVPLAQVPMVRAAMLLLRWMNKVLLQDQASWLMLSGFVSESEEELLAAARFDARLRQQPMRQPEQSLDDYLLFLNKAWQEAAPLGGLRRKLLAARRFVPANSALSFAEWVHRASQVLEEVNWPGSHGLGSEDYQVQARWSQLLDAVSSLAFDGGRVEYDAFLDVLEQQAGQTIFSPESHDAPVQILGPLEAAGLTFDALWFLGADDASWPAVARPHPFLSRFLQRKHNMPHANSDVDWKLAQQVTLRLTRSATRCVFSYAAQNGEDACRPSTLVSSGFALMKAATLREAIGANEDLIGAHDIPATGKEEEPAAVAAWPVDVDAGGAEILRNQAACAFRAFATKRLVARPMEDTDWGLEPRERGVVVHTILDKIWAELKDRDSLRLARSENRLPMLLAQQVDDALQRFKVEGQRRSWNEAYLHTERERIVSLIDEWLAYEEGRAEFAVETREEKRTAGLGALRLQVRVDRVDAIEGGRVIIDYKTGAVKADGWDGDRPDDPQLPIYAAYGHVEDLKGVLLAKVAEEKPKFVGQVEDGEAIFPKDTALAKQPYGEETLGKWKGVLLQLANGFLNGEAQVDPKRYPKTCQYCKLPGLCRIAESDRADGGDENDGDSD